MKKQYLNYQLLLILLMIGNIETNPGPTTPTLEGKDFDGINPESVILGSPQL